MLDFDDDEQRQLESNKRHWDKRLHAIDRNWPTEPDRIRAIYEVKAQRIEPVGLGLPLAGDGVRRWQATRNCSLIKNGSATSSRSASSSRFRPAGRPGLTSTRTSSPDHSRFLDSSSTYAQATTTRSRDPRLSRLRHAGPRLGAGRPGRQPRRRTAARSGSHAARIQRDAAADLCRPRIRPKDRRSRPWMMLIQTRRAGHRPRRRPPTTTTTAGRPARRPASSGCLRETQVPIGLLSTARTCGSSTPRAARPRGHLTFTVAGDDRSRRPADLRRPAHAASAERLFTLPDKQRLPAILAESRKYQNVVSTKLAEQVLAALYELLRGFQAADDQRHGDLLRDVLNDDPNHVYAGLLTRAHAAGVHPLRRGPRPALQR